MSAEGLRFGPLISAAELLRRLSGSSVGRSSGPSPVPSAMPSSMPATEEPRIVLLDCGFDLFNPASGRQAWEQAHLPGAVYAHLDEDLSGPKSSRGPIEGGRHPLPDVGVWAARVGAWGIDPSTLVVAYDNQGGPYAARAWWMLRWIGHNPVAVLDGGLAAWVAAGGTLQAGRASAAGISEASASAKGPGPSTAQPYPVKPGAMATVSADELRARLGRLTLIDARAGERYRGETEPLDTRAGHIPGALNRFFKDNLQADGRFKPVDQLQREWAPFLAASADGQTPDARGVVHQCGSGVTACHNLLALAQAGWGEGVLFPGSWSEWSADASRPCALG